MTAKENDGINKYLRLPPAERCAICRRTLEQVGGMRLIANKLRGICLSPEFKGGGNADYPYQSVKLDDSVYLLVWGEKDKWTPEAIERAKTEYLNGRRPWMCQVCGERNCSECGAPINLPMGSDVLYDSGCSSHVAIFPFHPGCINPNCKKYKESNRREAEGGKLKRGRAT